MRTSTVFGVRARNLDRTVQFMRSPALDDGYSMAEAFSENGGPVRASRRDVGDGEKAAADSVYAEVSARFVVRSDTFTRGITSKDRLVEGGKTFAIVGIKELDRGRWIEITATARTDLT